MPLSLRYTSAFKRDFKRAEKQGRDTARLRVVLELLVAQTPLPEKCRDHDLGGEWKGTRDCHLAPDWLLLYRIEGGELILIRLGSHSEVFG
jgi:mRNA interferase YafQ